MGDDSIDLSLCRRVRMMGFVYFRDVKKSIMAHLPKFQLMQTDTSWYLVLLRYM